MVLSDHRYWFKKQIETIRHNQSAIALQSGLLENLIITVAGGKSKQSEIDDYLPIKLPLDDNDPIVLTRNYLGKNTIELFFKLIYEGIIPPYIVREFRLNKVLWTALDAEN